MCKGAINLDRKYYIAWGCEKDRKMVKGRIYLIVTITCMMSSRKGDQGKRGQKYQNSRAYKPSRYGETRKTKLAAALPLAGLCARCKEKIEWKKKYDKYKPLTGPRKCVICEEKKVRQAYYRLCQDCAESNGVCAKCGEAAEVTDR